LCVEELGGRRYAHASDRRQVRLATAEEAGLVAIAAGSPVIHLIHNAVDEWFRSRRVMPPTPFSHGVLTGRPRTDSARVTAWRGFENRGDPI
jgi:hypothetical protein